MGTLLLPERSLAQRMKALETANVVRSHRARLKVQIAEGRIEWPELLADPMCDTMKLWDVLICLPKLGRVKVNRAFAHCRVSPSKTLAGLTDRQLAQLVEYLR
jgi:hypothetical protein